MNSIEFNTQFRLRNPKSINTIDTSQIVGIAGCGGLGSNIAVMLARAGIQKIRLADHEKVELSNLNRQHFFIDQIGQYKTESLADILQKINPEMDIKIFNRLITAENVRSTFHGCKIVIEAFDTVEAKSMMIREFSKPDLANTILITASGLAGIGPANEIKTEQLSDNIFICGDFSTPANDMNGLTSTRVMLVAAHQAHIALQQMMK